MKFNKKGQAAMEFLMTYGWAILVVLAAIGALAYFGVLSPDRFLPSRCQSGAGFSCTEFKVSTDQVQVNIQNNLGQDLAMANVTMEDGGATSCFGGSPVTKTSNGTVSNGDSISGGLMTFSCANTMNVGDRYEAEFDIVYQISGQTVTHTVEGSITGEVEQ